MVEYIEREALLKQMQANFQQASWYGCDEPMYPIVEETIYESPAADVAPVVHGRWEYCENLGIAVCTECGFERELDANFGKAITCPNCGAKMDLQEG